MVSGPNECVVCGWGGWGRGGGGAEHKHKNSTCGIDGLRVSVGWTRVNRLAIAVRLMMLRIVHRILRLR